MAILYSLLAFDASLLDDALLGLLADALDVLLAAFDALLELLDEFPHPANIASVITDAADNATSFFIVFFIILTPLCLFITIIVTHFKYTNRVLSVLSLFCLNIDKNRDYDDGAFYNLLPARINTHSVKSVCDYRDQEGTDYNAP